MSSIIQSISVAEDASGCDAPSNVRDCSTDDSGEFVFGF
jgi:hypothetical protein